MCKIRAQSAPSELHTAVVRNPLKRSLYAVSLMNEAPLVAPALSPLMSVKSNAIIQSIFKFLFVFGTSLIIQQLEEDGFQQI